MTYLTGEVTVIHDLNEIDFENFAYSKVQCVAGGADCTEQINGTTVVIADGSTLEVIVHEEGTILTSTYVLLGNPVPPQTQYKTGLLSATTETLTSNIGLVETYQFVNIKNGNPTKSTG